MQHQVKIFIPTEGPTEFISMINPHILEEKVIMKYLYVKQHSITKLLYFGVTESEDPIKYRGSGIYWNKHLKKHGKEFIKTLYVWTFNYQSECTKFALNFSVINDIVKSRMWANEILENGFPGMPKGFTHSHLTRKKMSNGQINRRQQETTEQKERENRNRSLSQLKRYKDISHEEKERYRQMKISEWENMPPDIKEIRCKNMSNSGIKRCKNMTIEEKFMLGKTISLSLQNMTNEEKEVMRKNMSSAHVGSKMYNNTEINKWFKYDPGSPWVLGKLHKNKI